MPQCRARPFLKWAGGKTQLLDAFTERIPPELGDGKITRFVEPFVGGGAVYFHFSGLFPFEECHIFDANEELVLAYTVVQRDVDGLIDALSALAGEYLDGDEGERKALYYAVREEFNRGRAGMNFRRYSRAWVPRAAQLLFLNRTCFNGLFRVNSKGGFNVPFGTYANPTILYPEVLRADAERLQNTRIHLGDFSRAGRYVGAGTFVYFDPPYRPLSRTASFTQYSRNAFGDAEQRRLAAFFARCDSRGAKLMLSNSDPRNIDPADNFFDEIYAGFRIERVPARRMINSDAGGRGEINEIIVRNY
ncbi:DNA adenine methylase [Methanofollis fontis]|uniref:site-specific DNA-methyltransferase (adenine-specific) n=1 Tax=Methanofollis fontis TaxID=2052832 RepID=A0A483CQK6_9EURY|nr:DNA adenine methylase [Methanofollis fontis]TAJ45405.1 modification methylase [Methanofollis fontis]